MSDHDAHIKPGKIAPAIVVVTAAALIVCTVVTLSLQYTHGPNLNDTHATGTVVRTTFDHMSRYLGNALAADTLVDATASTEFERLRFFSPQEGAWWWVTLGAALLIGTAIARLRLSFWPIHPVLFLVWGTWGLERFGFSFLIGWLIRTGIERSGGLRSYRQVMPLMIGIIAGELLAALGWMIVGATFYFITGTPPTQYSVFP